MTPGLQNGPPFPAKATKNAVVAIASLEIPSVPMVVGICEIDIASLEQVQGAKGHAVRSEHWDGDEIWAWSTSGNPGGAAPDRIEGWEIEAKESDLIEGTNHLTVEDDEEDEGQGGVLLVSETRVSQPLNRYVEGEDGELFEKYDADQELSTKGE